MTLAKPRKRAVQQRAEETKDSLLAAGVDLFSSRGFEGVSIRAIEEASETKRGLVAYHFGSKENFWKAVAKRVFEQVPDASSKTRDALQGLDKEAQIRWYMTSFVYYSAEHPEISRLIIQEGKVSSWRLDYLVENYVRPRLDLFSELLGQELDAHMLYTFIGAATVVFDVEAECESLFGFNPRNKAFVKEHARRVCDLLISSIPSSTAKT